MPRSRFFLICLLGSLFAADSFAQYPDTRLRVASPDGQIVFILGDANASQALEPGVNDLRYAVDFHGKWLMDESVLGLKLEGQPALGPGMKQVHVQTGQHDETYTIPVGKTSSVRDHYNSALVDFADDAGRKLSIEVRAFDDGVAFRYIIPDQPSIHSVRIEHELTQFRYAKDAMLYPLILDGFQTPYEDEYQVRQVSGIHHDWLVGLPLLAEVSGVGWVAVTEADIDNYAGMYLRKDQLAFAFHAELSPHHRRSQRYCGRSQCAGHHALARVDDRRRARPPDRIEHHSQFESALEDCGHVLDQGGEVGVGLVVR
jgi:alpha-glucosidase